MPSESATQWPPRSADRETGVGLERFGEMENKPKVPDEHPPAPAPDTGKVGHTEHGVPPEAAEAEPTGLPNSDRHSTETVPTKQ